MSGPVADGVEEPVMAGTSFDATGEVPCARTAGQPMAFCAFGVVRMGGGDADVTVFWPDGGNRVLFFENGVLARVDISEADGGATVSSERQADLTLVRVGDQRFEIPDAVIFGG